MGRFFELENPAAMVDPFETARSYVDESRGRSLKAYLDEIRSDLEALRRA